MKERPILFSSENARAILADRKSQTRRVVKLPGIKAIRSSDPNNKHMLCDINDAYPDPGLGSGGYLHVSYAHPDDGFRKDEKIYQRVYCPYEIGDRLWVRETHYSYGHWVKNGKSPTGKQKWKFKRLSGEFGYLHAGFEDSHEIRKMSYRGKGWYKRPSIFMPRQASRITIEVTAIRVERLQDISIADTIAEGFWVESVKEALSPYPVEQDKFARGWDSLNAKRKVSWDTSEGTISGPGYSWDSNPWVGVISFIRSEK